MTIIHRCGKIARINNSHVITSKENFGGSILTTQQSAGRKVQKVVCCIQPMLENHVRYYLCLLLESFDNETSSFIPSRVGAEAQRELRKLDDMMLCYRVLCKLSTGTDNHLSLGNLEHLSRSEEYGWLIDFILQHFSSPPQYDENYAISLNNKEKLDNFEELYLDGDTKEEDPEVSWIHEMEELNKSAAFILEDFQ